MRITTNKIKSNHNKLSNYCFSDLLKGINRNGYE